VHRFRILVSIVFVAASAASPRAHAQTMLPASAGSTPWDNTATLATGSGLTINLGLGVEYLIVGGGGGGGGVIGGGGGAGAFLTNVGGTGTPRAAGNYTVTVGAGGAGGVNYQQGRSGSSSSVFGITAAGGGGGGFYEFSSGVGSNGSAGGSGGGGGTWDAGKTATAGGSATASSSGGLGNTGGGGRDTSVTGGARGGGGGGAGSIGTTPTSTVAGNGGSGTSSVITGVTGTFAGGGGGGTDINSPAGTGGSGIGGSGGTSSPSLGKSGTANTGSGGGGGGFFFQGGATGTGGGGGSGIVIVRYQSGTSLSSGGNTSGTTGVWWFERFTSSGTLSLAFDTANLLATQSGAISGTGGLTYDSAGTLRLTAANTYSGPTTISAGTLVVGDGGTTGSIGAGAVTNNAVLAINRSDSLTVANAISGTGSLTQQGGGTTVLSGSNSFTGGSAINAGILALGSGNAIGSSGTISFGGGTLQYSASNTTDYSGRFSTASNQQYSIDTNGQNVSLASALASSGGSFAKLGSGTVTLTGSNAYSGGTTISAGALAVAAIADAGASNIGTAGPLTLAGGTLDYTGSAAATTARVVDISAANTTSTIGVADAAGRLTLTGKVWNSGTAHPNVVLNKTGAGTLEIAGAGSNVGTSLVVQSGTVVLNATLRAVYEVRGLDAGATLQLGRSDQIFSGDAISTTGNIRMTGGTLDLNGFNETVNRVSGADFSAAGTGVITSAAPATLTFGNNLAGRPSRFAGMITGSVAINVKGTNPVTLSGDNAYAGTTTIQDAGTQLRIGVGGTTGSLGTGAVTNGGELVFDRSDSVTVSNAISGSGGVVHAGAGTTTLSGVNTYAGPTTIAAGRLVGSTASLPGAIANASQLEFAQASAGTFASAVSGTGSFTKTGVGNLILTGSSSYTGATSIDAGRLLVNGALGNSPVTVLALAELGGSGSIAGPVSIAAAGTLSPGNSIASLATGTATFASGATFAYEVDSTNPLSLSSAADLLVVSGDLNLDPGNGSLLTLADLASSVQPFVEDTTIFAMINYAGAWNGGLFTYGGNVLSDGERFMVGEQQWEIDYNRTSSVGLANFTGDYLPSSNFVAITAVPEPSTLVLMAIGAGLAACLRCSRHRST
jgi:autotransporter-associated beta strand protein